MVAYWLLWSSWMAWMQRTIEGSEIWKKIMTCDSPRKFDQPWTIIHFWGLSSVRRILPERFATRLARTCARTNTNTSYTFVSNATVPNFWSILITCAGPVSMWNVDWIFQKSFGIGWSLTHGIGTSLGAVEVSNLEMFVPLPGARLELQAETRWV